MTPQQIFDTVATHLFTQGHPAKNPDGFCVYRAYSGDKCAVGCLIPDSEYEPQMESQSVKELVIRFKTPLYFAENLEFLTELQKVHDFVESWTSEQTLKLALYRVASDYKLNPHVLIGLTL